MEVAGSSIKIIDSGLAESTRDDLSDFAQKLKWSFGWASKSNDQIRFWHAEFPENSDLSDANSSALRALTSLISYSLPSSVSIVRQYANAHTYGCGSSYHTDGPTDELFFSAVYFAHRSWQEEWGGELSFAIANESSRIAVSPMPGRLILFPGSILHSVRPLSRECFTLRVSLVFKLRGYLP